MTASVWLWMTEDWRHRCGAWSLKDQYEFTNSFACDIENICKPDCFNLVLHKHLGDVFYTLGSWKALEKTYGKPFHFIIDPRFECLAKLWGITNFTSFDLKSLVIGNKDFLRTYFDGKPEPKALDHLQVSFWVSVFSCVPAIGKPCIADSFYNNFYEFPYYWCFRWAADLGVNEEFRFEIPQNRLELSGAAERVLEKFGGVDKIVLFAPEGQTATELPVEFWEALSRQIKTMGYTVLVNSARIRLPGCISLFDLKFSLEDVLALGLRCHAVFSLRTGLADVLVGAGERLYVFTPAILAREKGSLNYPFERPTHVNEILFWDWKATEGEFEGFDLQAFANRFLLDWRRVYVKHVLRSLVKPHSSRFWARLFRAIGGTKPHFPLNNRMNDSASLGRKLTCGLLTFYERQDYCENNDKIRETRIFGGVFSVRKREAGIKVKLLGIPIWARKDREFRKVQILGIPVSRKSRARGFYQWLETRIKDESEVVYGPGQVADHVVIIRHNLGETTLYLAKMKAWLRGLGAKRPLVFVWRERDLSFFDLFMRGDPCVRSVHVVQSDINCFLRDPITKVGATFVHAPTHKIVESIKAVLPQYADENFAHWILKSMNFSSWTDGGSPVRPTSSGIVKDRAQWLLNHLEVEKPFVLLCPEAVSIKCLGEDFWLDLAEHFSKLGYDVIVNCFYKDGYPELAKVYKHCSPEIATLFNLAERAEHIVSMASGLGVLLSLCGKRVDLIYTAFRNKHIGFDAQLALRVYSVKNMPFEEVKSVNEFSCDSFSEQQLILNSIKFSMENEEQMARIVP